MGDDDAEEGEEEKEEDENQDVEEEAEEEAEWWNEEERGIRIRRLRRRVGEVEEGHSGRVYASRSVAGGGRRWHVERCVSLVPWRT